MVRAGLLAVLAGIPLPAEGACRLALELAFDVSRSVDAADYSVQRKGLVLALQDPEIRAAFLGPEDHVAIAVYEWSGRRHQEVVVGWTEVTSEADLDHVAGVIAAREGWGYGLPTAIGYALEFGRQLFDEAPDCVARVIDVSGDGRNNEGMSPADAYRRKDFGDILVNALAIGGHEADIVAYYRGEVIRGRGAFVEVAPQHTDFPRAIRRKLMRELAEQVLGQAENVERGG
ncbi:DUF1194 domain-containing protein [Ostreiculturibacter nitratireducens]|uniref:DUF1194 domain-containing protein n=1 Tax=Ostreiculturibacter nitratireducens TaxID=3075226 RepID=UPI0031B64173